MQQLVITAVGPDRPGLLDELTGWLLDAGANVADSRMVNLRGQFALILLAEAPAETDDSFCDRLSFAGQELGLTVQVCPQSTDPSTRRVGVPFQLRVYAMDQPGIIHRITHVLHEHGVNVEELQTRLEPGSYSGTPLSTMSLHMTVPAAVQVSVLRQQLEKLCDALNCDVEWQPGIGA